MYDYGDCHNCGTRMEERRVKQSLWTKGKLLIVENVPAGVCPQCGAKFLNADVSDRILDIIAHQKERQKIRTIAVPVFRFRKVGT